MRFPLEINAGKLWQVSKIALSYRTTQNCLNTLLSTGSFYLKFFTVLFSYEISFLIQNSKKGFFHLCTALKIFMAANLVTFPELDEFGCKIGRQTFV